jgi:hypothetical protein
MSLKEGREGEDGTEDDRWDVEIPEYRVDEANLLEF